MPAHLSLETKLKNFPPIAVRLLARTESMKRSGIPGTLHWCHALTTKEIAAASGLDPQKVEAISKLQSWDGVPVDMMMNFLRGCGADLDDRNWLSNSRRMQTNFFSKRSLPRYLLKSPEWHTVLHPLIALWVQAP